MPKHSNTSLVGTFLKVTFSCFIIIVVIELGLRFLTDKYKTYTEKIGNGYLSPYQTPNLNWYHVYPPNSTIEIDRPEFSYSFTVNELGIPDKSIKEASPSKYKILCLGDSFTEGVGVGFDNAWPRYLEARLDSIEVINGGIGGSDLFFSWKLFEDKLQAYDVDEVLFFTGHSDLEDIAIRGGDERFLPNGQTKFRSAPWFEPLYQYSYVCRFIFHEILDYSFLLVSSDEYFRMIENSCYLINQKLETIHDHLSHENIQMKVVIHPVSYEVKSGNYSFPCFEEIGKDLQVERLDLLQEFNEHHNFNFENFEAYYWPIDNHFTAQGYQLCAEQIFTLYTN